RWQDSYNAIYHSGATHWLKHRVVGKVTLREGRTVAKLKVAQGKLDATISDGAKVRADHILLATGYKVDITKLTMIDPSLRAEIKTDRAIPSLSHWFESSVPGLFFVGLTSLRAFGPLYRFVAGCGAAARRVADGVMRARGRRSRAVPTRDGAATVRSESPAGRYDYTPQESGGSRFAGVVSGCDHDLPPCLIAGARRI